MAEDLCDTNLGLAIGGGYHSPATKTSHHHKLKPPARLRLWFPCCGNEEEEDEEEETASMDSKNSVTNAVKRKTEDCDCSHGMRKKLRLTEDQTNFLKESFLGSNTLTAMKKLELSQKLGLRPRQVEVWFQNRRARTKVKQSEVDCEELKRWCWNLTDENKRLKRELQELRFCGLQVEAKRECPSCERNNRAL